MPATIINKLMVATPDQLESTITQYIAQGFVTMSRTPTSATMLKKKEFNILWAIIGFFLCAIPLIIYAVHYSNESDQMVEIVLAAPGLATAPTLTATQMSGDGNWWWDGQQWQSTATTAPPQAQRSPDGAQWWDGKVWRPVPGASAAGLAPPPNIVSPPQPPGNDPAAGGSSTY